MSFRARSVGSWLTAVGCRAAIFGLMWWAVSEGDTGMLAYGGVIVAATVAASLVLLRPRTGWWRAPARQARGALVLSGWFLWRSVLGALDVTRRAIATPPDLDPEVLEYRFAAQRQESRVLITLLLTLMPGSLAMKLDGDCVVVHSLHRALPVRAQLRRLEELVMEVLEPGAAGSRDVTPSGGS